MTLPFLLAIFLSAFLLFQVQPLIGRYVLPWFGGGPAVWTTCLLFFQLLLVAGYAYAHWLGTRRGARLQGRVHAALLAASLLCLPLNPVPALTKEAASSMPSARILLVLTLSVGGPYLMLSATGPLLQRWFALEQPSRSPWRLYALSNVGSFLALLSYPFVVEPLLRLRTQSWLWSGLYACFAILCAWLGLRLNPQHEAMEDREVDAVARPGIRQVLFWIGLAACGSTLLIATTNLVSQDVAVIPFLWVAPLSVYLLTFVLVFENERWYARAWFAGAAGLLVPAACAVMVAAVAISPWWQLAVYLSALFVVCTICHGELARSRPSPEYLTSFYLAIAAGGAVGGVFAALIAPHVFTEFSEYPIALAAACLLAFVAWMRAGALARWTSGNLAVRVPLMALLIGGLTAGVTTVTNSNQPAVASWRNFYGILRLTEKLDLRNGPYRELTHGRIRHGFEFMRYPQRTWPTAYYGPHSGVGLALKALDGPNRRVAIIGLGAGTLAAWARPGDTFRFYEINPDVVMVAKNWFSYLKDSKGKTEIVLGDARVELERELASAGSQRFDLIAVDAFSSDAIPLHLLTAECGDIYRKHLEAGGLLLFHISNRLLDLEPVTRGLAQHLGWDSAMFVSGEDPATGETHARWVLVTANSAFLNRPEIVAEASRARAGAHAAITWTDDFASLWHVLKF